MRRFVLAALAAASVLALVPAARAKAPPSGIDVCGAANACTHLTGDQAERLPGLFIGGSGSTFRMPAAPAPYFTVHWQWDADQPVQTTYYVPGADRIRRLNDNSGTAASWWTLDAFSDGGLKAAVQGLQPAPAATFTYVTVGGLTARDPQSYFHHFVGLTDDQAVEVASSIWEAINGINLRENIAPTRSRADLVLEKRGSRWSCSPRSPARGATPRRTSASRAAGGTCGSTVGSSRSRCASPPWHGVVAHWISAAATAAVLGAAHANAVPYALELCGPQACGSVLDPSVI